jgi:GNAT superfamily N-acetyltransferase
MSIQIRPMAPADLEEADRIFHTAFGTFLRLPDPASWRADCDYVRTRYRASPEDAFSADYEGKFAGSNFSARWGSVAFFGPLTIRPELWDKKIGQNLVEAVVNLFDRSKIRHAGLFTFPHSPKHLGLYQKFGFWPRMLTALLSKPPQRHDVTSAKTDAAACRKITDAIYEGLDVTREIQAVQTQKLGATVFTGDAFAVCHCGPGTEAGKDTAYVKFGAAKSAKAFETLLDAVETMAADRGLAKVLIGVNTARIHAYQSLLKRGYRMEFAGVSMTRPNQPGYDRPDAFVIDDWR